MRNKLTVAILAAGKGKRMKNPDMAKVMATINDKPLVRFVLDSVIPLEPSDVLLVVGHQKQMVVDYINGEVQSENLPSIIKFVEQNEQLGTGHAVLQCYDALHDSKSDVLILAGDVPLIKTATLKRFIENHSDKQADLSVLTVEIPEPRGYGRIIRDDKGNFKKIVEEKDADDNEKQVKEINSGIFIVNSDFLFDALKNLSNNNAQKEYYLTDIIEIFNNKGLNTVAFLGNDFRELQGINSVEELEQARKAVDSL